MEIKNQTKNKTLQQKKGGYVKGKGHPAKDRPEKSLHPKSVVIFVTEPNYHANENAPDYDSPFSWEQASSYAVDYALKQCKECRFKNIHIFHVVDIDQFNEGLKRVKNIVLLYVIGHSSQDALFVGAQSLPRTNISSLDEKNDVHPATLDWNNLNSDATIYLWGCHAGQGENSIAEDISKITGKTVIAPDQFLNFHEETGEPFMRPWHKKEPDTIRFGTWRIFSPKKE